MHSPTSLGNTLHGYARIPYRTHLMNQLVERMLSVGAGFSPHDWTSVEVHSLSGLGHTLAVTFHIALLEIGGKAVQILIVGQ